MDRRAAFRTFRHAPSLMGDPANRKLRPLYEPQTGRRMRRHHELQGQAHAT
jgi:hypothetical protein